MNESELICWDQVKSAFQKIWGYENFRPPQGEIIKTLLEGKDALIIMPTGGGKSICFQLPALLKKGLTLVVSPLVALMENQVRELLCQQLPAALLHSEIPKYQRQQTLQAITKQQLRLLYLSPETLLSKPVWEVISRPEIVVNGLILDEAHCLAQWGETFRPTYRRLGVVRPTLLKDKPPGTKIAIAAFTATADPETQTIIKETLALNNPHQFLLSPYRSNLNLKVKISWTPRGRKQQIVNFINSQNKQSGLLYVRSRKDSEFLSNFLQNLTYNNAAYHAGLTATDRRKIEEDWLIGKIQFVVCTSAFGMGINKSNLRWICHYHSPLLLSEYIQEVGRGGRDGKPTEALTLISEPTGFLNPEDRRLRQFFCQKIEKEYQKALQISRQIPAHGNLDFPKEKYSDYQLSLAILNSAKQLIWPDPFSYKLIERTPVKSVKYLLERQKKLYQQTRDYLKTKKCRWGFLLTAFGFNKDRNFRCGHCDNCDQYRRGC
jgi:ATP-dependent DNA helicase RecQ